MVIYAAMAIDAVLFDAGGVLIVPIENAEFRVGGRTWKVEEAIGAVEETDFYQRHWQAAFRGEIPEEELWRGSAQEVEPELVRIYRTDEIRAQVNEEVLKLAQELKDTGLKIGLLSNNLPGWFEYWDSERNLRDVFDLVILSYETGLIKPDPEIYRLACRELGLSPEEVLFIDDGEKNVSAAQEVGLQGLIFGSNEVLRQDLKELKLLKNG